LKYGSDISRARAFFDQYSSGPSITALAGWYIWKQTQ